MLAKSHSSMKKKSERYEWFLTKKIQYERPIFLAEDVAYDVNMQISPFKIKIISLSMSTAGSLTMARSENPGWDRVNCFESSNLPNCTFEINWPLVGQ